MLVLESPDAELVVADVPLLGAAAACVCGSLIHETIHVPAKQQGGQRQTERWWFEARCCALEPLRYCERHFPAPLQLQPRYFRLLATFERVVDGLRASRWT